MHNKILKYWNPSPVAPSKEKIYVFFNTCIGSLGKMKFSVQCAGRKGLTLPISNSDCSEIMALKSILLSMFVSYWPEEIHESYDELSGRSVRFWYCIKFKIGWEYVLGKGYQTCEKTFDDFKSLLGSLEIFASIRISFTEINQGH